MLCASAGLARADFNPVALTSNSYTFDIVVEASYAPPLPNCITVTTGSGLSEGDNTFFEQTYYRPAGLNGSYCGVPHAGTVFTNMNNTNMTFLMPPTYLTNNDVMVYSAITTGTLLFATPTIATNLAILGVDGNGSMVFQYVVNHTDGSTETGTFSGLDWFTTSSANCWGANGRVTSGGTYNNINTNAGTSLNTQVPYLDAYKITVTNGAVPVASVTINYTTGTSVGNFFGVSGNASGNTWTPIPVTGFNEMAIVPSPLPYPVNATMDNGTNLYSLGNTWFEQGWDANAPASGLPPSGSIFSSSSQPTHHYQMGNYKANNAILLDTNHLTATIVPATPAAYTSFAFLTAGGNIGSGNKMTNLCIMMHADGVNETNIFIGYDWFEGSVPNAVAYNSQGRTSLPSRTLNNINNGNPKMFETYFTLVDPVSPVTNIVLKNLSVPSTASTTFIMAVSATAGALPPVITSGPNPATQAWFPGQTATFQVSVSGTAPITNIWYADYGTGNFTPLSDGLDANGSYISGSSTTTLTISNLTAADAGNYEYLATNVAGGALSGEAALTVNSGSPVGPIIDSQVPANSPLTVLSNHSTTLSVTVDGSSSPPIYYQWYEGSTAISNATGSTYVNLDTTNATFYCIVSNFVGTATSAPVVLDVEVPTLSAYQSAVFAYHPVSYWPLNETNGTTALDWAGVNDGTYLGGYTLGQPGVNSGIGIGTNATSVAFDGSSGYVDIPYDANLDIAGHITVIAWIQTPVGGEAAGHFGTVLGHSDSSYRLTVVGSTPRWVDSSPDDVGTANVGDGNWHQIVGVWDGNEHLYIDGQPTGPAPVSTTTTRQIDVTIAASPDYLGSRNFEGNIAQVAIITNALTAAQVGALYYSAEIPATVSITPVDPSIYTSASVTFTAVTNGSPTISVQWYYIDSNNTSNAIPGATNDTYTIASATLAENGYQYGAVVANAYGTNSASTTLSVQNGPPYILPGGDLTVLNSEAYAGAPVTFTIGAAGSEPIFYQWLVDGIAVSGATNATFTYAAGCGSHTVQVSMTNAFDVGSPVLSQTATVVGDQYPESVTFTNAAAWQLNGTDQSLTNDVLTLTEDLGSEASSAFYNTPQYVGAFTASYTYWGQGGADGTVFVLQTEGPTALGGGGGELGFYGIEPSFGFELNIYSGSPIGIAIGTNGETLGSGGGGAGYGPTGNVYVNGQDPILFQLTFANGNLGVVMTDQFSTATYTTNYEIGSITNVLGGTDLAYIGFTGADGGVASYQTVSNFVFTPTIASATLSVTHTPGFVTLSWPSLDPTWQLEQSANLLSWIAGPTPTAANGTNSVKVATSSATDQYYRLVRLPCPSN